MIIRSRKEYRHIKLCIVEKTEASVQFYIRSQTHIRRNFAIDNGGFVFFSEKTGWYLKSVSVPEVRDYEFTLFTRGGDPAYNTVTMTVSKQVFEIIQETVNDYNETFNGQSAEIPEEQLVYVQSRRKNVVCKPFKEAYMFVRIGTELSDFCK